MATQDSLKDSLHNLTWLWAISNQADYMILELIKAKRREGRITTLPHSPFHAKPNGFPATAKVVVVVLAIVLAAPMPTTAKPKQIHH